MRRWIIFVLCLLLLSYLAVSSAADDTLDPGKGTSFNYPFLKYPIGLAPESGAAKDKNGQGEVKNDPEREKAIQDKKVDDAIKKAWEEK